MCDGKISFTELRKTISLGEIIKFDEEILPEDLCESIDLRELVLVYQTVSKTSSFKQKAFEKIVEKLKEKYFDWETFLSAVSSKDDLLVRVLEKSLEVEMPFNNQLRIVEKCYTAKIIESAIGQKNLDKLKKLTVTREQGCCVLNTLPKESLFVQEVKTRVIKSIKTSEQGIGAYFSLRSDSLKDEIMKKIDEVTTTPEEWIDILILKDDNLFCTALKRLDKFNLNFEQWFKIYQKCYKGYIDKGCRFYCIKCHLSHLGCCPVVHYGDCFGRIIQRLSNLGGNFNSWSKISEQTLLYSKFCIFINVTNLAESLSECLFAYRKNIHMKNMICKKNWEDEGIDILIKKSSEKIKSLVKSFEQWVELYFMSNGDGDWQIRRWIIQEITNSEGTLEQWLNIFRRKHEHWWDEELKKLALEKIKELKEKK